LEALLQVGYENQVCFGIEFVEKELLSQPLQLEVESSSLGDIVGRILASAKGYVAEGKDGVVLIQKTAAGSTQWLNLRVRNFRAPRSRVQEISNLLFMNLMIEIDPVHRGFAGNYSPGDPKELIGPFSENGKTVPQLLDLVVSSSKGGMWIANSSVRSLTVTTEKPLWTIVEYSWPFDENCAVIRKTIQQYTNSSYL